MDVRVYFKIVEEWEKKYGKTDRAGGAFRPDLSRTRARRPCEKCGKDRAKMHRHHTGNDFFWANLFPDEFAPRYIEFHEEDIVTLCNRCHGRLHKRYDRILWQFVLDHRLTEHPPTVEVCKHYQKLCREECEKWLKKRRRFRGKSTSGQQRGSSKTKKS